MFEIKLPGHDDPKKDYDELYDKHMKLVLVMLTQQLPELEEKYHQRMEKAAGRKHFVESVPNQARWFIKFQKGVSDILKAKILPMNKATYDAAKRAADALDKRDSEIKKKVIVAAHNYPRKVKESSTVPFTFGVFAKAYNELVATYTDLVEDLEKAYKEAVRKEKEAIELLKQYLAKKDNWKEALDKKEVTESQYEQFKKKYENLAKSL